MRKTGRLFLLLIVLMSACSPVTTSTPLPPASATPTTTLRPTPSWTATPIPIGVNEIGKLRGSDEQVYDVAWSPDSNTYAVVGNFGVRMFDTQTEKEIWSRSDLSGGLKYSPNSQIIALHTSSEEVILNVANGQVIAKFNHKDTITPIFETAFSFDGNLYAYGTDCDWRNEETCKALIQIWDIATQQEILKIEAEKVYKDFSFGEILFDPSGAFLLVAASDNFIYIWDIATGKLSRKLSGHSKRIGDFVFSHDGETLISYEEHEKNFQIFLWDWKTKARRRTITNNWLASTDGFELITFSEDDAQLNIILRHNIRDKLLVTYDLASGKFSPGQAYVSREDLFLNAIVARGDVIRSPDSLAYSPDGQTLAVGSRSSSLVVLWDLRTQKVRAALDGIGTFLQYNHRGDRLIVLRDSRENWDIDSDVSIWDVERNVKLHTFKVPYAYTFDISPDDSTLAVNSFSAIQLWDIEKGILIQSFATTEEWTPFLSYSADGRSLSVAMTKRFENLEGELSIQTWDTSTGNLLPETLQPIKLGNSDYALGLHHDTLAVLSYVPDEIALWDVKSGKKIQALPSPFSVGPELFFSPSGQVAIIAHYGGFYFYDIGTGDLIYEFKDSEEHRSAPMTFSSDGKMLATWAHNGYIPLWDISRILQAASTPSP